MLIKTTENEQIDVDPRDIVQVTASGVTVLRTLLGSGQHTVRLTSASAAEARAAMMAPTLRTELELFQLAATFGRRDTLPFRIPGTTVQHQVECVVMEPSDLTMFASAIGVPATPMPREVFVRQLGGHRRRLSDRLEESRQVKLDPDEPGAAIAGEGGHDVLVDYLQRAQLVPACWRDFARAIADLPAGAEANLAGLRAKALELLGEKATA